VLESDNVKTRKKHLFVINPRSFPARQAQEKVLAEIRDCFAGLGEDYSVHVSRYPRDAVGFIRKWVGMAGHAGPVRVYAVGGDGILFDCLNGIVGLPDAELASVPYGNGNDMIRAFGEHKRSLFRDIRLQAASAAIPADIIYCGTNYAFNFCTIGMESDAIMNSITLYSGIAGKVRQFPRLNFFLYTLIFYFGGMKAVFNKKVMNQYYTITIDGEDFSGAYGSINIANGPCYGGDKNPVITAVPDDGVLDALFFKSGGSVKAMTRIMPYVRGEFRRFPGEFAWKRLRRIEIRSEEPLLVDLDGEVFFDTTVRIEIIPQGVKLVAPGGIGFARRDAAHE
jgi:diacylglycerol kinase family enzyme